MGTSITPLQVLQVCARFGGKAVRCWRTQLSRATVTPKPISSPPEVRSSHFLTFSRRSHCPSSAPVPAWAGTNCGRNDSADTAASPQDATPSSIPAIVAKALRFEPRAAVEQLFGACKYITRTSDGQWFTGLGHVSGRKRRQTARRFCNGAEATFLWG